MTFFSNLMISMGPLPIKSVICSAALFCVTEGRRRQLTRGVSKGWLKEAKLTPNVVVPTLVHCGA